MLPPAQGSPKGQGGLSPLRTPQQFSLSSLVILPTQTAATRGGVCRTQAFQLPQLPTSAVL